MALFQVLLINAAVIAIVMFLLWLVSVRIRDASIVDIFWGLGFVLVAWTTHQLVASNDSDVSSRSSMLAILTTIWGVRLSLHLAWRNLGKGEDARYQAMREHRGESFWWMSLLTVFLLQGTVMWLVSLPLQVGQYDPRPIDVLGYLGIAIWVVGFLFESIGDYQLAKFKSTRRDRNQVLDRGLWRYTRHPNYFGNAMIWWGLFLLAVSSETIWLIVSPLVMNFLLVKVSGVALLERDLSSRSEQYRDYIRRTSAFLPWPPKQDRSRSDA